MYNIMASTKPVFLFQLEGVRGGVQPSSHWVHRWLEARLLKIKPHQPIQNLWA